MNKGIVPAALSCLILCTSLLFQCFAEDLTLSGHVKNQYLGAYYPFQLVNLPQYRMMASQGTLDMRIMAAKDVKSTWQFDIHAESVSQLREPSQTSFLDGGYNRQFGQLIDRQNLFDISSNPIQDDHGFSIARLDRLSVRYHQENSSLTVGRQAVTWGNGQFFNPLDFVNPFLPLSVDKDYKTGQDMLLGSLALSSTNDLQLIVLPRRENAISKLDQSRTAVTWEDSTIAAKLHSRLPDQQIDLDAVMAAHSDDLILGGGWSTQWFEAVIRNDLIWERSDSGYSALQVVANIDRTFVIADKNVYWSTEYFYNGYGTSANNYLTPSAEFRRKQDRGELFSLGRHYLAEAIQLEASPLVTTTLAGIWNMADGSAALQPRLLWSVDQDIDLLFGALAPIGKRGSEFGGIALPQSDPAEASRYLYAGYQFLVKLSCYF